MHTQHTHTHTHTYIHAWCVCVTDDVVQPAQRLARELAQLGTNGLAGTQKVAENCRVDVLLAAEPALQRGAVVGVAPQHRDERRRRPDNCLDLVRITLEEQISSSGTPHFDYFSKVHFVYI